MTEQEWKTTLSHRIVHIQRAAELLGGPDVAWTPNVDDDNPSRFYDPLPSGPHKGATTDKAEVQRRKQEYYRIIGWDAHGIPTSQTLRKLGLDAIDASLQPLRET